eukprot:gnl/TRDRNA2_/TRDRNA2_145693_c1_seq1.p1 gnl/TRDRNA2_/TRDRNA2_145693_c1~~gnl/TRDRNA2_/TRDRNA2_145693_c1_seq1.p1  ORF type:complete len:908 (+),score=148.75 gnl/TRDRNA2_/TRDRNA2_145693_c1_seq1:36-2726(+)
MYAFLASHAIARHAPALRHMVGNLVIARGPKAAPPPASWHELVRLADFGLAAAVRARESATGVSAGLPGGPLRGAIPAPDLLQAVAQGRRRLAAVAAQPDVPPPAQPVPQLRDHEDDVPAESEWPLGADRLWPLSREAALRAGSASSLVPSPSKRLYSARNSLESRARTATAPLPVPPALDFGRISALIAGESDGEGDGDHGHQPRVHVVLWALLRRLALPDEPLRPRRTFLAACACFGPLRALAGRLNAIVSGGDADLIELSLAVLAVCSCEAVGRAEIEAAEAAGASNGDRRQAISSSGCVAALVRVLEREQVSAPVHMQCLAVLQRLSLRRALQSHMIDLGVVDWVLKTLRSVRCLGNVDGVLSGVWRGLGPGAEPGAPDFSLEFASALLMNLTLRAAGRKRCGELGGCEPLLVFIEHPNPQVRTHINGALYSLLGSSPLRADAQRRGAEGAFRAALSRAAPGDELHKRQLEYLLVQLGRNATAGVEDIDDTDMGEDAADDGDNFLDEEELAGKFLLASPRLGHRGAAPASDGSEGERAGSAEAAEEALRRFRASPTVADAQQRRFHAFVAAASSMTGMSPKKNTSLRGDICSPPYGAGVGLGSASPPPGGLLAPTPELGPEPGGTAALVPFSHPSQDMGLIGAKSPAPPVVAGGGAGQSNPASARGQAPVVPTLPVPMSVRSGGGSDRGDSNVSARGPAAAPAGQNPQQGQQQAPQGVQPPKRPPRGNGGSRGPVAAAPGNVPPPSDGPRGTAAARGRAGAVASGAGRGSGGGAKRGSAATSAPPPLLPPLAAAGHSGGTGPGSSRARSRSAAPGRAEATSAATAAMNMAADVAGQRRRPLRNPSAQRRPSGGASSGSRAPSDAGTPRNGGKGAGSNSLPTLPMISQRSGMR